MDKKSKSINNRVIQLAKLAVWLSRRYKTLLQSLLKMWKNEKFTGLYGGMKPHLLKTIPGIVITFLTYEALQSLLITTQERQIQTTRELDKS